MKKLIFAIIVLAAMAHGQTNIRVNNIAATGTVSSGNVIVNPSSTGTGAALTVGGTTPTTGGVSFFVGALGAQNERFSVVPADGSSAAARMGALSVRLLSAGLLTGSQVAGISSAGVLSLGTSTGTLPATIANDGSGGFNFSTNAVGLFVFQNAGNFVINTPGQTISWAGATSGTTTLKASPVASGALSLPAATDTLVGKATTDTLTNKTLTAPVIGTTVMSEAPRMTFSAHVTGGANQETVTVLWGRFIPDKPITVTRVTVVSYVSQLGATTAPQFQVTDGTTVAATITIANSSIAIDSGALSANYAAGANVDIKCSTSQAGTTTFPVFNIIVEYKMQ